MQLRRRQSLIAVSALVCSALMASPVTASEQAWQALGAGTNAVVEDIAVASDGTVYIAGGFTTAGGVAANRIAKWDGTSWSALGTGLNDRAYALAIAPNGDVYAGGSFSSAGGNPAAGIAKWNGSTWSALGTGVDNSVYVLAIASNGDVYAGGSFGSAGGDPNANGVAKWDGTSWSALGTGTNGLAEALAFANDGSLYVGGSFSSAGGNPANNIARWNGSTWSALGSGTDDYVWALAVASDGTVYAGGEFDDAGGVAVNRIAMWDGAAWSPLSLGVDLDVYSLAVTADGSVYAGGNFTTAGSVSANRVAQWATVGGSSTWSALGTGFDRYASALAIGPNGTLYAGGSFTNAGGLSANRIAAWPPASDSETGANISYADFTYHLPDGRECSAISPQRVQVGTMVGLPGVDAMCKTMPGSSVAGWTIPVPHVFTGYGSATEPFPPGLPVRVIESQRFTLVPFDPVIQIDYDANIAADDTCVQADVAHGSDDGRVAHVWVPREDFAMARTPAQAPCVPDGYRLTGWNTAGDGSGMALGLGTELPGAWESQPVNRHRLYAVWSSS